MTFQIIEPCHGTASFCGPYVLANGIEVKGYVANVVSYLDPSTEISLEGFIKIYLALFKIK